MTKITTREEQLAQAYEAVARSNHYMVGIVEPVTEDERDAAEQYLIRWQNDCGATRGRGSILDLALDCLEQDRKQAFADSFRAVMRV